jgi:hypothetical protein
MAATTSVSIDRVQKILGLALRPTTPDNEALSAIRRVHTILNSNGLDETAFSFGGSSDPGLSDENARLRVLLGERTSQLAQKEAALKDARRACVKVENELFACQQDLVSLTIRHERVLRRGISMRRTLADLRSGHKIAAPALAVAAPAKPKAVAAPKPRIAAASPASGTKPKFVPVPFATLQAACERLNPGPARWEEAFYRVTGVDRRTFHTWRKRDRVPKHLVDSLDGLDWTGAGAVIEPATDALHTTPAFEKLLAAKGPRHRIENFVAYGQHKSGGRVDWKDVFCARFGVERDALRSLMQAGVPQAAFDAIDAIDWKREPVLKVPYDRFTAAVQQVFSGRYLQRFLAATGGRFDKQALRGWHKNGAVPIEAMQLLEAYRRKAGA